MSAIIRPIVGADPAANAGAAYRLIWRWHFYAGLFCLPFIVVLALSGSVYLLKPQIDAYLDRDLDIGVSTDLRRRWTNRSRRL